MGCSLLSLSLSLSLWVICLFLSLSLSRSLCDSLSLALSLSPGARIVDLRMVFFAQGLSEGRVSCQNRSPAERGPVAGTESAIGAGSESATSVKDKCYNLSLIHI